MTITTKVKSFAHAHKPELVAVGIISGAFAVAITIAKTVDFARVASAIEDDSIEIVESADGKSFTIRDLT